MGENRLSEKAEELVRRSTYRDDEGRIIYERGDDWVAKLCTVHPQPAAAARWLSTQLKRCCKDEGLMPPTCSSVAYEVYGTASRWQELQPVIEAKLEEMRRE